MAETRTTRLGLPQWSDDADVPSRSDFNEAFSQLEVNVPMFQNGAIGDRPGSGVAKTGMFFVVTSGQPYGAMYFWNGSGWVECGGTSSIGDIKMMMASPSWSAGDPWIPCDGRVVAQEVYPELYALIGLSFEIGDSRVVDEDFRVPDFRGRTPVGAYGSVTLNNAGSDGLAVESRLAKHSHAHNHSLAAHNHGTITSSSSGSHSHNFTSATGGAHTHELSGSVDPDQAGGVEIGTQDIPQEGGIEVALQTHTHETAMGNLNTVLNGGHTHTGSTLSTGSHTHTVAVGSHTHTISATADYKHPYQGVNFFIRGA